MNTERRLLDEALPGYDVAGEVGRGGWGVVFEAAHRTLERQVAVKQLPRAFGADPEVRARFLAEARVVASLDHPHIVPLYDFVERDGMCLLVMELMPDGTLWDRFSAGGMSAEASCAVALAVLTALAQAHGRGVLHRDIKPENILFNREGVPKLADFGIAKVLGDGAGTRTATGVIMGTPAYMAPEQGTAQPVGPATDLYAVGVLLYELLAGRLPFEASGDPLSQLFRHVNEPVPPLGDLVPTLPEPLADVVMHALAKRPDDRHADAATFARALDNAARTSFGGDWLARSGVPVLADRTFLDGTSEAADRSDPGSPRSGPTFIVDRDPTAPDGTASPAASTTTPAGALPTPPPTSPQPTPPPTPVGPTDGPAAAAPPPATPPAVSATPPATPATGDTQGRKRGLWLGAAAAAVVALVLAVVVLGGKGDGGDDVAASTDATVPAAAKQRFEEACRASGVDDGLCDCALSSALDELTPGQFMANDQLLSEHDAGLTREVTDIFASCQAERG